MQNKNRFNIYTFYFSQLHFYSFGLPTNADNVVDRRLHCTVEPQKKKKKSHQDLPKQIFTCNKSEGNFLPPAPLFPRIKTKINRLHIQYVHCHSQSYVQNKHYTKDRRYSNKIKQSENKKKTSLQLASSSSCFGMCNEISSHLYIPFHKPHVNWLWHYTPPSCSYKNKQRQNKDISTKRRHCSLFGSDKFREEENRILLATIHLVA